MRAMLATGEDPRHLGISLSSAALAALRGAQRDGENYSAVILRLVGPTAPETWDSANVDLVRELRESHGLTQGQLASRLPRTTQKDISRIEQGEGIGPVLQAKALAALDLLRRAEVPS